MIHIFVTTTTKIIKNMTDKTKNSIKNKISKAISSNDAKEIVLRVGYLGTELRFTSKKEFGKRVLSQLELDNVSDIAFKGVEDNTIKFQVLYNNPNTFCNDRGYGSGRYMGD